MRQRLTIVAVLVIGMFMSATGVGYAFQGLGQSGDNASEAQYGPDRIDRDSGPADQPDRVLPVVDLAPPQFIETQRERQAEVGSSPLPFTGFVAIPVLVLGAVLVLSGLVLRRRAP